MAQIIELGAAPDIDATEDMASEAYDEWSEQHEKLEDIADDILDRLEE